MEDKIFTENEVRRKLAELGYHDIPKEQMKVFMQGELFVLLSYSSSSYWLFRLIQDISLATVFFHSFRS